MADYNRESANKISEIIEKLKNNINDIKNFKNPTREDLSKIFHALIIDKKITGEDFFLYADSLDIPLITQIEAFEGILRKHRELTPEEYKRVNFLINSYGDRLKKKDISPENRKKIDNILFKEYGPAFGNFISKGRK